MAAGGGELGNARIYGRMLGKLRAITARRWRDKAFASGVNVWESDFKMLNVIDARR